MNGILIVVIIALPSAAVIGLLIYYLRRLNRVRKAARERNKKEGP